jgi:orotate phosphoribosyltransferase
MTSTHDPAADRVRLLEILVERSVRFGRFTLASGAISPHYVDVRKTSLDAEGATVLGRLIFEAVAEDVAARRVTAVGGLTLGADPLVVALAIEAFRRGHRLEAFLVRKAQKTHGTENLIEGNLSPGAKALVVEDVLTSGGSALAAIEAARAAGATVERAWCVVDRKAGGHEALAAVGVRAEACFELDEVLAAATAAKDAASAKAAPNA